MSRVFGRHSILSRQLAPQGAILLLEAKDLGSQTLSLDLERGQSGATGDPRPVTILPSAPREFGLEAGDLVFHLPLFLAQPLQLFLQFLQADLGFFWRKG